MQPRPGVHGSPFHRPLQANVLPRRRVVNGFHVRVHGRIRHHSPDVRLDFLEQVVPVLHRPVAGNEHVHRDEPPRASLPRAHDVSRYVHLEQPAEGGHIGFVRAGEIGVGFLAERVFYFFERGA